MLDGDSEPNDMAAGLSAVMAYLWAPAWARALMQVGFGEN